MWSHNPGTYGHICHTPTMPCLCTGCHASLYEYTCNPMTQWYNNHLLPYQGPPQNPLNNPLNPIFHGQEAMANNEIDSLLLLNPDQNFNQYQGQFNPQGMQQVNHHGNFGEQQQEQIYDFSRAALYNTPASFLNASLPAIVPEVTPGSYSNTVDWSSINEFSFLPFHPGNLIEERVGSNSNSASLSSEGKQQLDASNKPFTFPPMSRQDRVLRYFEKKKTRKYEKKLIRYSSRKTYAQTRPRIRGRFVRRSQVDAQ